MTLDERVCMLYILYIRVRTERAESATIAEYYCSGSVLIVRGQQFVVFCGLQLDYKTRAIDSRSCHAVAAVQRKRVITDATLKGI